jgi:hypothetical protein
MFIFELAFHLGMPVYKILQDMPAKELQQWGLFLEARPIGWREDNRTAMQLNAAGVKQSGPEIFPTLRALKDAEAKRSDEEVMQSTLRKSVFGALLEKASSK